jgi:hypothetical protein
MCTEFFLIGHGVLCRDLGFPSSEVFGSTRRSKPSPSKSTRTRPAAKVTRALSFNDKLLRSQCYLTLLQSAKVSSQIPTTLGEGPGQYANIVPFARPLLLCGPLLCGRLPRRKLQVMGSNAGQFDGPAACLATCPRDRGRTSETIGCGLTIPFLKIWNSFSDSKRTQALTEVSIPLLRILCVVCHPLFRVVPGLSYAQFCCSGVPGFRPGLFQAGLE